MPSNDAATQRGLEAVSAGAASFLTQGAQPGEKSATLCPCCPGHAMGEGRDGAGDQPESQRAPSCGCCSIPGAQPPTGSRQLCA